jgi:hypothetical protein
MSRFVFASLLLGAILWGAVAPAWALDYQEPVVPPEVSLTAPPTELRLQSTTLPVTGEPVEAEPLVPNPEEAQPPASIDYDAGCALWNWPSC